MLSPTTHPLKDVVIIFASAKEVQVVMLASGLTKKCFLRFHTVDFSEYLEGNFNFGGNVRFEASFVKRIVDLIRYDSSYQNCWLERDFNAELERMLRDAPMVYKSTNGKWYTSPDQEVQRDTHTARLVCIEPIEQESEERKLLRELIKLVDNAWNLDKGLPVLDRARKLLEEK